ncbi:hypothetical protein F7725_025695 [Dissostichus mawsoni]|uniref:Uncharacterized protein n=1 Tax=Dissostichus mawsoni TaxID=36200 RepID=A0A7J5X4Y4_DISMA|nr:hypothetical protein F7725_025695 [Dissostichus mawsoni]
MRRRKRRRGGEESCRRRRSVRNFSTLKENQEPQERNQKRGTSYDPDVSPQDQDQMKMIWFWFCWVLGPMVWASPPLFSLHPSPAIFSEAEAACSPGRLASLFSDQDAGPGLRVKRVRVLGRAAEGEGCLCGSGSASEGVQLDRGGQPGPAGVRWAQEPQETCTTLRCAAIRLNQTGTSWGLIPVSCRNKNPYICKGPGTWVAPEPRPEPGTGPEPGAETGLGPDTEPGSEAEPEPEKRPEPEPNQEPEPEHALAPEAKPTPQKESEPEQEPTSKPAAPEPSENEQHQPSKSITPQPIPATQDPEPDLKPKFGPEPDLKPDSGTEPDLKPDSGTEPDLKPDSGTEPDPCPRPLIAGTRSLREDNSTQVLVECWSGLQLDLVCSGRPPPGA